MALIVTVTLNPALDRTLSVSRIAFNEVVRAVSSRLDWGGKGFNVSRALRALGAESVAMGLVGGATGRALERGLNGMGIATDLVQIAGETRTNTVIVEAGGGRYLKVNEAGPTVRREEWETFRSRVCARARPGDLWVLSGSLPPGAPPDFYAQLVALLQERGAKVLLDTGGGPLRLACEAGPYLVKPNVVEAEEVTGREIGSDADAREAAAFFLQLGVGLVALSLGDEGLLLTSEREVVRARPPRVRVCNPVGAGDSLLAGVAWALERGLPLEEAARWGVAAGTAAAMCEGVSVGTQADVEALYKVVSSTAERSC